MSSERQDYDVVVIGGGPAGENAAGRAAEHGLRAVVVERQLLGGECSYWGCMPSKAMLRPGEVLAAARRVPAAAAAVTGGLDVDAALRSRTAFTSGWDDAGQVDWLDGADVDLVRGHARIVGPGRVEVTGPDGATQQLTASRGVVIAVGSRAAAPPVDGLDEVGAWDNRDVTEIEQVPSRLIVLGGGAIGAEMAQGLRRLGAEQVDLVEAGERLLGVEEPFAGELVAEQLGEEGVRVRTDARAQRAERDDDGTVRLVLDDGSELEADELLVATGRRAPTGDLGLDAVGVSPGRAGFVEVDDDLRVPGTDWLYVIGDANGRALLTHHGKHQGRLVGDRLAGLEPDPAWVDHSAVTRVVFTDPQVAAVGLTEQQAARQGHEATAVGFDVGSVAGGALLGRDVRGRAQLGVDRVSRRLLGATFVGPGAGDLLHAATVAIVGRVTIEQLWHAVPPFPTVSEVWLRLLEELRAVERAAQPAAAGV